MQSAITKKDLLNSLQDPSRWGMDTVLKQVLDGSNHWSLVKIRGSNTCTIVHDKLSRRDSSWSSTSCFMDEGIPVLSCPLDLLKRATARTDKGRRWQQAAVHHMQWNARFSEFKESLAPGQTLSVNGFTYTLARPLKATQGWVVARDGTEFVLRDKQFDTAVKLAMPA